MRSHLPGNPFDPRDACTHKSKVDLDPTLEGIEAEGVTDATLIYLGISALTHAVMAHAYEQRTANLIAMMRETYDRAGLRNKIADRLGWPEGGRER